MAHKNIVFRISGRPRNDHILPPGGRKPPVGGMGTSGRLRLSAISLSSLQN